LIGNKTSRNLDLSFPRFALVVIHKHLRDVVIPEVPYLVLGEKQADMQTFQVFKAWKV